MGVALCLVLFDFPSQIIYYSWVVFVVSMAGVDRQLAGLNGLVYVGPSGGVGSIGEILSCLLIFVYISYVNVNVNTV